MGIRDRTSRIRCIVLGGPGLHRNIQREGIECRCILLGIGIRRLSGVGCGSGR